MKKIIALLTVLMILMLQSCATNENTSKKLYQSLDTAVTLYNTSYNIVKTLDEQGKIKDDDKARIKKLFSGAELSLKTSLDALAVYIEAPTLENKDIVEQALLILFNTLSDIAKLIGETDGK